ncbi:hypothetical protein EYF80_023399 [Liparis tanakae]|uniref:Secreted protein n=1 Tax=Liparis tanakae TaxID=230148 RepID=A0A4Z2HLC5_9TELE|nr:hypothetical protein EYF80_023399 [Liparis tanakae]
MPLPVRWLESTLMLVTVWLLRSVPAMAYATWSSARQLANANFFTWVFRRSASANSMSVFVLMTSELLTLSSVRVGSSLRTCSISSSNMLESSSSSSSSFALLMGLFLATPLPPRLSPSSGLISGTFIMSFSSSSTSSGERVDSRLSRSGSSLTCRPVRVFPSVKAGVLLPRGLLLAKKPPEASILVQRGWTLSLAVRGSDPVVEVSVPEHTWQHRVETPDGYFLTFGPPGAIGTELDLPPRMMSGYDTAPHE